MLIKRWGARFEMAVLSAYQMLFGGIILLILSALTENPHFEINASSVTVVLVLAVLCSIVQFTGWFYLLRNGDPGKTSAFLFLVPIFGVITSWMLLGEKISWETVAGGVLVCIGIFLVNWEGSMPVRRAKRAVIPGANTSL
jgi:drug/metabolite transporter (DMT)-like permease